MKKKHIAKFLLAAMIFTGCNKTTSTIDSMNSIPKIERDESIKELPLDPVNLIKYINEKIENVDENKKQLYLFTLEDTLISNLSIVGRVVNSDESKTALSFVDDESTITNEDIEKIDNETVKNEIIKSYEMFYEIYKSGNGFVPRVNYEKILELADKNNDALVDYYSIKLEENRIPTLSKGIVNLTPEELLKRVNRIEEFILKYKNFPRNKDFITRYQSWLYVLLTGTTLSPIVDNNGEIIKSYKDLAQKLEPKTIADYTFLDAIKLINKNKFDDELMDELRSIVKQSVYEIKDRAEMN